MTSTAPRDDDLPSLLVRGLREMLHAGTRAHGCLPAMIAAACDPRLRHALALHRARTAQQMQVLQRLLQDLGGDASPRRNAAMTGIVEGGAALLRASAGRPAGDAAIILAAQAIGRHEASRYRSLLDHARELQLHDTAAALAAILAQKKAACEELHALAASAGLAARAA